MGQWIERALLTARLPIRLTHGGKKKPEWMIALYLRKKQLNDIEELKWNDWNKQVKSSEM